MTPEEYRLDNLRRGFPYCDVCNQPAIVREHQPHRHTSVKFPYGIPADQDRSGHEPVIRKWWKDYRY